MAIYKSEYQLKVIEMNGTYSAVAWKGRNQYFALNWPRPEENVENLRHIEKISKACQYFFSNLPSGAVVTIEYKDALRIKDYVWSGRYLKKNPKAGKPENRESLLMWAEISNKYKLHYYQNSKNYSGLVTLSPKNLRLKGPVNFGSKIILRKKSQT